MEMNGRVDGITRPYTREDVERLRGTVHVEHTLARLGAERLRELLAGDGFVRSLGALSGGQAVQMVKAGLQSIYVSGWQVAADANLSAALPEGRVKRLDIDRRFLVLEDLPAGTRQCGRVVRTNGKWWLDARGEPAALAIPKNGFDVVLWGENGDVRLYALRRAARPEPERSESPPVESGANAAVRHGSACSHAATIFGL